MIWDSISSNNAWWVKYYYMENIGIDMSQIEYSEDILFCRNFIIFLGDLQRWQKGVVGKSVFANRVFPGFDNNTLSDDEWRHRDIIDYFLKYKPEICHGLGFSECPTAPCGEMLYKYRRAFDFYASRGDHSIRYKPSDEDLVEILDIMYR